MPGGPYTRHSKGYLGDKLRGTTEYPWFQRPGDLLRQTAGVSTLGFLPGGAGGWCSLYSGGPAWDRGSLEAEVRKKLETVQKSPGPKRGDDGGEQWRIGGREGTGGEGSIGWREGGWW